MPNRIQESKSRQQSSVDENLKEGFGLDDLVQWTVSYPFECAQTLMKIGYEPISPRPENFFGDTYLALPNSFSYVRYMISIDGLSGCFRGFAPTVCQRISALLVTNYVNKVYQPNWDSSSRPGKSRINLLQLKLNCNSKSPPDIADICMKTGWRMLTVSLSTIASHPLYVITVRMVAQFVGREGRYLSLYSSLKAILNEDGFLGFFRGLVPRLLSENIKIVFPAAMFLAITRIFHNRLLVNSVTTLSRFLTERYAYQLDIVAATMAIQNSSMIIGQAPFLTRNFTGWMDCWTHLCSLNIQNRGRSSFFRYYSGPTTVFNGELKPAIYLGPYYYRLKSSLLCAL